MRITGGTLHDFGLFHEVELPALAPGFVLIYGENEAGKSTLLAFLRQMLFDGFLKTNQSGYVPPLAGSSSHGELLLAMEDGPAFRLDRQKVGRDAYYLFDQAAPDVALPTGRLEELLGGVTRDVYHTLFAFTLDELRELDAKSDEEVNGVLYGATLGVSPQRLKTARETLADRADALFRDRGSKPLLNAGLARLAGLQKELREAQAVLASFQEQSERLAGIERELPALQAQRQELEARCRRLDGLVRGWDDFTTWQRLRDRLAEWPAGREGVIDAAKAAADMEQRLVEFDEQLDRLTTRRKPLAAARADLSWNPALIAAADTIESLSARLQPEAQRAADEADVRRRLTGEEQAIADGLAFLGNGWSVERVQAVNLDIFTRDAINRHEQTLIAADHGVERATDQLETRQQAVEEAERVLEAQQEKVAALATTEAPPPPERCQAVEEALRDEVADQRRLLTEAPKLEALRQEVAAQLQRTVGGWSEERLQAVDEHRLGARASDLSEQLKQCEAAAAEAAGDLRRAEAALREAARTGEEAQARLEALPAPAVADAPALQRRRQALRELRQAIGWLGADRPTEPAARGAASRSPYTVGGIYWMPVVWLALGVILALVLKQPNFYWVGGVLAAFTWFICHLLTRGAQPAPAVGGSREHRRQANALVRQLGLAELPDLDGVDRLEDDLLATERQLLARDTATTQLEGLRQETARRQQAVDETQARLDEAQAAVEAARAAWAEFLREQALDESLTPADLAGLPLRLQHLREALRRRDELAETVAALQATAGRLQTALSEAGWTDAVAGLPAGERRHQRVRELLVSAEQARRNADDHQRETAAEEELAGDLERAEAAEAAAQEQLDAAREALIKAQSAWQALLAKIGLDTGLEPSTCRTTIERFEELRRRLRDRAELEQKLASIGEQRQAFAGAVGELAGTLGLAAPGPAVQEPFLSDLRRDLKAAREAAGEAGKLDIELDAIDRDLEATIQTAGQLRERLQTVLNDHGAASVAELRAEAGREEERRQEAARCEQALERLLSATALPRPEEVEQAYADVGDKAAIESTAAALKAEIEQLADSIDEMLTDRGRLQHELKELRSNEEVGRLRAAQESTLAELRDGAREWAVAKLALWLLDRTRKAYEQTHQPPLFQHASRLFRAITGGRYEQVVRVLEEPGGALRVKLADGKYRLPSELSRGTREQLFLCLRLGYVLQHGTAREPVPLILDDVLVNADAARAAATVDALTEVAKETQILLFTCHPHLRDLVQQRAAQVQTLTLRGGQFV